MADHQTSNDEWLDISATCAFTLLAGGELGGIVSHLDHNGAQFPVPLRSLPQQCPVRWLGSFLSHPSPAMSGSGTGQNVPKRDRFKR